MDGRIKLCILGLDARKELKGKNWKTVVNEWYLIIKNKSVDQQLLI